MEKVCQISICIPAYKNVSFLKRLLDSIAIQTFTDYEVIVSDDSPDNAVQELVSNYSLSQPVRYFKNRPALGTPENWNAAIRHAQGKWIKLMHTDDWFTNEKALQIFNEAAQQYSDVQFFFAAFQNVVEATGKKYIVRCTGADRFFLSLSPLHLFKRVYVGNPSCTFIKTDTGLFYDNRFKFVVDFEYYIRCIRELGKYKYIDDVLLNIGFHDEQVTKYTFLVPSVQIPENLILLEKLGKRILYNPIVYDYYWRMFRNLKIRSVEEIKQYYAGDVPSLLKQIIRFQSRVPASLLNKGIISKLLMTGNYFISLFRKH